MRARAVKQADVLTLIVLKTETESYPTNIRYYHLIAVLLKATYTVKGRDNVNDIFNYDGNDTSRLL